MEALVIALIAEVFNTKRSVKSQVNLLYFHMVARRDSFHALLCL